MKRSRRAIIYSLTGISWIAIAAAEGPTTKAKLLELHSRWKTVSAEELKHLDDEDVVRALRAEAKDPSNKEAVILLVRAGDAETIANTLQRLRGPNSIRRYEAADQLKLSRNPDILKVLAADLDKHEDTNSAFQPPESLLRPTSVFAAEIMCGIVANSSAFPPAVNAWAAALQQPRPSHREKMRAAVRQWWHKNEKALLAGDYSLVIPGSDVQQ